MTTPTGKLAWGQAGNYDAADDRAVITAVTGGRIGLVRPPVVAAGSGLQIIITGGWLGVATCDDRTSAVVGSRENQVVMANPGPASGSRDDVVWCDTHPDEGTWELSVMTAAQAATRSGVPLVRVTVPAGANLASQMDLRPVDAAIERRLLSHSARADSTVYSSNNYTAATTQSLDSGGVDMEPGQWYRVRYSTTGAQLVTAPGGFIQNGECRIGVGYRTAGAHPTTSILAKESSFNFSYIAGTTPGYEQAQVEWVFRHGVTDAPIVRVFSGRIWAPLPGVQYRTGPQHGTGTPMMLTVEDIGS